MVMFGILVMYFPLGRLREVVGLYYSKSRSACWFWDSVPIGSLRRSCSYQVCFPWWLRHGAMDPYGGNPRWENVDRSDLRIYTFILVIRLSKVKQLAFFLSSHKSVECVLNQLAVVWAIFLFPAALHRWTAGQPRQPSFFQFLLERRTVAYIPCEIRHQACPLTCSFFFWGFFDPKLCTN